MSFYDLPSVKDQLMKCVRCGQCRMVCPVFAEVRQETVSPRGHVFMTQALRDGKVEPTQELYDHFARCLLCETCTSTCPSGISIHEMNAAARSYIEEQHPSATKKLVFEKLWVNAKSLRKATKAIRLSDSLGMRNMGRSLGLTRLLPGDMAKAEDILDKIPEKAAMDLLPEMNPALGETKYKVAYFLGCATNLLSPSIAVATVNVLTHNHCSVVIPKNSACCGLPHVSNGKMGAAKKLVLQNLKVFNALDVDYIITDCASCSASLRKEFLSFVLHGEGKEAEIEKFAGKVMDLTVFLTDVLHLEENLPPVKNAKKALPKITYHDPCHLAKAQKIKEQPRKLLSANAGVEFVEMKNNDCCGGSGTYSLTHYDTSMKILAKKIESVRETGAEVVATCCPSCTMQLKYGLRKNNMQSVAVKHPVELINEVYYE